MTFDPWQAVLAAPESTFGAYTIVAVTQDSDLTSTGELRDVVEYAYTIENRDGIYTTRVLLSQARAGFGDFAIAEDVAVIQALYAL